MSVLEDAAQIIVTTLQETSKYRVKGFWTQEKLIW